MGYVTRHAAELEWKPRREGDPRLVAELCLSAEYVDFLTLPAYELLE